MCCRGLEEDLWQRGYLPGFRQRVVDLVDAGRRIAEIAAELGISEQSIYRWRRQARIDAGIEPGLGTTEHAELAAARKRIREPETELVVDRRAAELLKGNQPKRRFAAIKVMAAEGLPIEKTCALLGVSVSGYYSWLRRAPSQRSGTAFDNAMIESFWSRIQVELLDRQRCKTRIEPANAIF